MSPRHLFALSVLLLLSACTLNETRDDRSYQSNTGPALGTFGIDTAQMDTSIDPGEDFYRYVNGNWLATTAIPEDKARYGSFVILADKSEADMHALLEELSNTQPTDPTLRKVASLYASWMDEATIEARGLSPLVNELQRIEDVGSREDLMTLLGDIHMNGPIGFGIRPDPKDTSRYTVIVGQSGLGIGRDYYIRKGEEFDAYRQAYRDYLATLFGLLGKSRADEYASTVFELEMKLAEVHWTPAQRRDVQATYNPMDRAGLEALAPTVDWDVLLAQSGLGDVQAFVVRETTAISGGGALLSSEPIETWKLYLTAHLLRMNASRLPQAFDKASFDFYGRTLQGTPEQRARWKRGVSLVNRNIGEGLGQAYVARHFPPGHKAMMDELVSNLVAAFATRLESLEWMDDVTREQAQRKLASFEPKIGYPDEWRDYSDLHVDSGKLFENVRNAMAFEWYRRVARLDEPVDRGEWFMTPPTVNAYYDPLKNQIVFPAGILQPPFFDAMADPAVNYGAIGAVIGHEIGHGFDDQGRQFDERGHLRNWWTEETGANFTELTQRLGEQFSLYCPIPGDDEPCVNGDLTMGENIGDLGGLEMAYTAYRLSLDGQEAPIIDGFTGDQRFFLSWSQVWRGKMREDALRSQLLNGPHSPMDVRGQAPLRNIDAWYEAFGVNDGDALYLAPQERVRIW